VTEEKKGLALHWQILIAMGAGTVVGTIINVLHTNGAIPTNAVDLIGGMGQAVGKIFLSLLKMVVVPLVFASLVSAVTGLRGQADLRKLGVVTGGYYLVTSILAITVGIIVANIVKPGKGVSYDDLMPKGAEAANAAAKLSEKAGDQSVWDVVGGIVYRMIPPNVVDAARDNRNMLAVIFFALVLGYFINKSDAARASRASQFFDDAFAIMMRMTHGIIQLAPYGIFGYIVFVIGTTGFALLKPLAWYAVAVILGLGFHACVTLPLLLWLLTRRNPITLFKAVWPALATAFSTASSSGTLPLTIKCLNDAGVQPRITSFVLPLGATINMDGTALYEAAAVLFIAQMLGDLTLGQQVVVAFTALLASVGAAGIPHAGTVMMVVVLGAVGLPTEAVLTILAVDRPLDMLRTTVNVWSDSTCTAVVAKLSGEENNAPAPTEAAA
jgi:proton glutamate symport protein